MKRERITAKLFDFDFVKERYGGNGRTLSSFLAETTNGIDLPLDCPDGDIRMVSLAPFAGENPDHFLVFTFIESRDDEPFDDEYDDAVALGEYDLLADRPERIATPPDRDNSSLLEDYKLPPGVETLDLKPDQSDQ
jgi:hypothetical protein